MRPHPDLPNEGRETYIVRVRPAGESEWTRMYMPKLECAEDFAANLEGTEYEVEGPDRGCIEIRPLDELERTLEIARNYWQAFGNDSPGT